MIRQILEVTAPAAGAANSDVIRGKWYGWRIAPALSGAVSGPVTVQIMRYDGAAELLVVNPATDGWFYSRTPISGVRLNSLTATPVVVDVWYATELGELAVEREQGPRGTTVYSTTVAAGGAIDTGSLDLSPYSALMINLYNADGAASRVCAMQIQSADGSLAEAINNLVTALPGVNGRATIFPATGAGLIIPVPPRARFTVGAAGASNGTLIIQGR